MSGWASAPVEGVKVFSTTHMAINVAAGLTAALGLMVLVGWYLHVPVLVQMHPAFVPMQHNTALGILLSGAGLLALAGGRLHPGLVCGAIVAVVGLLTIIEYGAGVDLGIDQFFMEPRITVKSSHPGRMAPTTASSFLLGGIALMSLGAWPRRHLMYSSITASLVLPSGWGPSWAIRWGSKLPMDCPI